METNNLPQFRQGDILEAEELNAMVDKIKENSADIEELKESGGGSSGIPEAPTDGKTYGRKSGAWTEISEQTYTALAKKYAEDAEGSSVAAQEAADNAEAHELQARQSMDEAKAAKEDIVQALQEASSEEALNARMVLVEKKTEVLVPTQDDAWYICDGQGNIMFKVSNNGIDAAKLGENITRLIKALGNDITIDTELNSESENPVQNKVIKSAIDAMQNQSIDGILNREDGLYICDSKGYVAFLIDKDGNVFYNNKSSEIGGYGGKKLYALCDSLGEGAAGVKWQKVAAELLGATYQENDYPFIQGGTKTLSGQNRCGMMRALNLAKMTDVGVILVENINDLLITKNSQFFKGSVNDVPFMLSQQVMSATTYASKTSAESAFMSEVAKVTPRVGTMIKVNYSTSNVKRIKVLSNNRATGSVLSFKVGGSVISVPSIAIGSGMNEIAQKIASAEWVQHGLTPTYESPNVVVVTGSAPFELSINENNTGLDVFFDTGSGNDFISMCFTSYDVSKWNDSSQWNKDTDISFMSIYKGYFEFLRKTFPLAEIYMVIFPRLAYDYENKSAYTRADGSVDWDAFRTGTAEQRYALSLYEAQREVCEYMNIPVIDLVKESGVNVYNMHKYFPNNNVHPTADGYRYFGEVVAKLLK